MTRGGGARRWVDTAGIAYATGVTSASDFPTTAGAYQSTSSGASSMYVVMISDLNDTSTTLSVSPTSGIDGQTFTLAATVASNRPNPGGSVAFHDGTTLLGSVEVVAGSATLRTSAGRRHAYAERHLCRRQQP